MIETKQDLLVAMAELTACSDATDWVLEQEGTARELWFRCQDLSWLIWFAGRRSPKVIADFAQRCSDRTKAYTPATAAARAADAAAYAAYYAAYDAASAARYAAAAADAAADAAAYAAYCAAAVFPEESERQRQELHSVWELIK